MIKSKLPNVGTTIFTVMSHLANEHGAINLSQGFPDFAMSEELIELAHYYMQKGHNQYAPMPGVPALREVIAGKVESLYSATYNPDTEVTITAGGTQAIYTAITAAIQEDDEVIVFEPAYDCYVPAIELNGGIPIFIPLEPPNYTINWDMVRKRVNHKTKLIIINTPHNPSGCALNAGDMMQLQKITRNTEILILSDEVYEHIIFDGLEHQSILRFPKLMERSFVVFSFGKTFHNTGWKMGYCLAPEKLTKEFRKVHQFLVFAANTPFQHALAEFMKKKKNYSGIEKFYQEKRDYFLKLIEGSKFQAVPASGTYFQLLSYKQITNEKDTDFAVRMTKEFGVASIPVSVFYHKATDHKMLRFCFAKENDTLEKAAARLMKVK